MNRKSLVSGDDRSARPLLNTAPEMADRRRLGEILVQDYRVLQSDIDAAVATQKNTPEDRLGFLMVRMGVVSDRELVTALAQQLECPVVLGLPRLQIEADILALAPVGIAEKKLVIPIAVNGRSTARCLILAMADPTDQAVIAAVEQFSGMDVLPAIAPEEDLRRAFKVFYLDEPVHRDMVTASQSMESLRAHMHEISVLQEIPSRDMVIPGPPDEQVSTHA